MFPDINLVAVLAAAISSMVVGYLWYSPLLFGNQWMELMGFNKKGNQEKMEAMALKAMVIGFIAQLIQAFVLSMVVSRFGVRTFVDGVGVGGWMWLGFVAVTLLTSVIYSGKSLKLFALDSGYQLFSLALMGGLLASWAL